jgi:leader peptidase (prepilin peptidase)/N-methyltransferase
VLAAAVVAGALTWIARGGGLGAASWGIVQGVLVIIAAEDIRSRRIPNVVTLPLAVLAILVRALFAQAELPAILLAGIACFGGFLVLAMLARGGIGMGDVKLAGVLGLLLGSAVVPALLIGTAVGGLVAAALLLRSRSRGTTIAYGPYLCAGAMVAIFVLPLPALV